MLGSLIGGGIGTAVKSLGEGLTARERTKQILELARSLWRPAVARAIGGSMILMVVGIVVIAMAHLYGLVLERPFAASTAGTAPIDALWSRYLSAFFAFMTIGGGFLGVTSHGRSKYDKRWQAAAQGAQVPALDGEMLPGASGLFRRGPVVPQVHPGAATIPDRFEPMPGAGPAPRPAVESGTAPTMDWAWSPTSERRLSLAHDDLQSLFNWLLPRSPYDISIGETTRSVEDQRRYVQGGQSLVMDSRHLERPAAAVDFLVIDPVTGRRSLGETPREIDLYRDVLAVLMEGSAQLGIPVTSGGLTWGWDWFHVELDRQHYPRGASVLDETPEIILS